MNLKPCPFCAFPKLETVRQCVGSPARWEFVVVCHQCGAHGPSGDTEQEARTNWNRRSGS